ncbi:hypothetical protein HYT56_00010 [Candidatus Woesearchaeota archaeon]|nr:hypothetical protein [Candidatus Woesearchaeota archaeon]
MKKEAVLILASLFFLIGAGCENSNQLNFVNCNKISNTDRRIECQDNFYNEQAAKTFDKNLCSRIINPDIKKDCISQDFAPAGCANIVIVEGEEVCADER